MKDFYIQLSKDFPLAYKEMEECFLINGAFTIIDTDSDHTAWIRIPSSLRDLYDWFDPLGIDVLITVEFDYGYVICKDRYDEIEEVKKWYKSRPAAEREAFTKAFEIREEQLKAKQK